MPAKPLLLEIKLDEIFGQRIPDDQTLRDEIAQEAIDLIVARTQEGKGVNGKDFTPIPPKSPYAKYKKGIVGNSKANLSLFGDMLGSIEVLEDSRNAITLGFSDELQNAKAYNHNTGDTLPKREFFGLNDKDKKKLAAKFTEEINEPVRLTASKAAKENELLKAIRMLNDIEDEITINSLLDAALNKKGKRGR